VVVLNQISTMEYKLSSDFETEEEDLQEPQSFENFSDMLDGEFHGEDNIGNFTVTETKIVPDDTCEEKEQPSTKKRLRASKEKCKSKKKGGAKMKTNSTDIALSSDEEGGNKRRPDWKEHWIVNFIHLRENIHDKFSGMKKQG
jgi:hypothetical protein